MKKLCFEGTEKNNLQVNIKTSVHNSFKKLKYWE